MLRERIESEMKQAMRLKDDLNLSVLRLLSSAVHNKEIEKRARLGEGKDAALAEDEIAAVIRSEMKKRKDAAEAYQKGGRPDAARREEAEADFLKSFLPPELSDAEIFGIIDDGVQTLGIPSEKEFGKLIGWVMARVKGQASGDRVSGMIRKRLNRP